MISYSLFVLIFLSLTSILTQAQDCSPLKQGYEDYFQCILTCYRNAFQIEQISGSICSPDIQLSGKAPDSFSPAQVEDSINCITSRCRTAFPPSVCTTALPTSGSTAVTPGLSTKSGGLTTSNEKTSTNDGISTSNGENLTSGSRITSSNDDSGLFGGTSTNDDNISLLNGGEKVITDSKGNSFVLYYDCETDADSEAANTSDDDYIDSDEFYSDEEYEGYSLESSFASSEYSGKPSVTAGLVQSPSEEVGLGGKPRVAPSPEIPPKPSIFENPLLSGPETGEKLIPPTASQNPSIPAGPNDLPESKGSGLLPVFTGQESESVPPGNESPPVPPVPAPPVEPSSLAVPGEIKNPPEQVIPGNLPLPIGQGIPPLIEEPESPQLPPKSGSSTEQAGLENSPTELEGSSLSTGPKSPLVPFETNIPQVPKGPGSLPIPAGPGSQPIPVGSENQPIPAGPENSLQPIGPKIPLIPSESNIQQVPKETGNLPISSKPGNQPIPAEPGNSLRPPIPVSSQVPLGSSNSAGSAGPRSSQQLIGNNFNSNFKPWNFNFGNNQPYLNTQNLANNNRNIGTANAAASATAKNIQPQINYFSSNSGTLLPQPLVNNPSQTLIQNPNLQNFRNLGGAANVNANAGSNSKNIISSFPNINNGVQPNYFSGSGSNLNNAPNGLRNNYGSQGNNGDFRIINNNPTGNSASGGAFANAGGFNQPVAFTNAGRVNQPSSLPGSGSNFNIAPGSLSNNYGSQGNTGIFPAGNIAGGFNQPAADTGGFNQPAAFSNTAGFNQPATNVGNYGTRGNIGLGGNNPGSIATASANSGSNFAAPSVISSSNAPLNGNANSALSLLKSIGMPTGNIEPVKLDFGEDSIVIDANGQVQYRRNNQLVDSFKLQ